MSRELRNLAVAALFIATCSSSPQASPPAAGQLNTTVMDLHEGQVVDGVPCLTADLPVHHIHVHVQILADGAAVTVPAGIGVGRPWGVDATGFITGGSCFAWLHTHDTTGVVHIVTPEQKMFTLGQLFEVWGHPLGSASALGYHGSLATFVNGQRFAGDPREVKLLNLENIVLELGKQPAVQPPALYDFATPRA